MWIAPSLRIGMAVLATFTLWLTPWSESHVRAVHRVDPVPSGPGWMRLSDAAKPSSSLAMAHTFAFRTKSDADLTEWALSQFERAGLQLPSLAVAFHDDKQPCNGHPGFYRSGTPAHIDICGFNWDRFVISARKTIIHELGHAWADYSLTEGARQRFLRLRGLTTWGDDQTPWNEQGSEQAAEIIAWAMDRELQLATMRDAHPGTLAQAYLQLTGTMPLLRVREVLDRNLVPAWKG